MPEIITVLSTLALVIGLVLGLVWGMKRLRIMPITAGTGFPFGSVESENGTLTNNLPSISYQTTSNATPSVQFSMSGGTTTIEATVESAWTEDILGVHQPHPAGVIDDPPPTEPKQQFPSTEERIIGTARKLDLD